ncbi:MAG: GAF domain-containing protein [Anaerolineaceae bacterium]|nr:GAF domain-containing protein [Anaerolineaceae bacterium]
MKSTSTSTAHKKKAIPVDPAQLLSDGAKVAFFRIVPQPSASYGYRVEFASGNIPRLFNIKSNQPYESWFSQIHPEDQKEFKKSHLQSLRKGHMTEQDIRIFHQQKKIWKSIHIFYAPELGEKGKLHALNGFAVDQTKQQQLASVYEEEIKYESLIGDISTNFIHISLDEVDQKIQQVLKKIGEALEVDQCCLFKMDQSHKMLILKHTWEHGSFRLKKKPGTEIPFEQTQEILQVIRTQSGFKCSKVDQLSKSQQKEIQKLFGSGIKSMFLYPLSILQAGDGLLCCVSHKKNISWNKQHERLFSTFAHIYKNIQDRQRSLNIQVGQQRFLELLATGKNFSETLTSLIQIIEEQWQGRYALIMLKPLQSDHLEVGAFGKLPAEFVRQIEINAEKLRKLPSCLAVKSGNRIITADLAASMEEHFSLLGVPQNIKACWSEPVKSSNGNILGSFSIFSELPRKPNEDEIHTLEMIAHLIGIAIDHKLSQEVVESAYHSMEQRVSERTSQLATLFSIQQAITSRLDTPTILQMIADESQKITGSAYSMIFLVEGDSTHVPVTAGDEHLAQLVGKTYPYQGSIAEYAIKKNDTAVLEVIDQNNMSTFNGQTRQMLSEIGANSMLAFPFTPGDQLTGAIAVFNKENAEYDDNDAYALNTLTCSAVIGLENARLYQDEQSLRKQSEQRRKAAEVLREAMRILNSNATSSDTLDYILTQASQIIGTQTATALYRFDYEQQTAMLEASFNMAPAIQKFSWLPIDNLNREIMQKRESLIIPDVQEYFIQNKKQIKDPRQRSHWMALQSYYKSFLIIPLIVKNKVFGSLIFFSPQHWQIHEEDVRMAWIFSEQAALAIENNRLLKNEESRAIELKTLLKVAAATTKSLSLDEMIQGTLQQIHALLKNTSRIGVLLWNEKKSEFSLKMVYPQKHVKDQDVMILTKESISVIRDGARKIISFPPEPGILLPLISREKVLGTLTIMGFQNQPFSSQQISLFESIADQISVAIENAYLYEQAEESAVLSERNRLARELHDAVTQTLFSASLIADVLPKIWERNHSEAAKRLEELRQLTRGALAEMRTLLLELRPSAIADASFSELLGQLRDAFTGKSRIPTELLIKGDEIELPIDPKVTLYRITQEALNNISKHANASQVFINLNYFKDSLTLEILDNGQGFDPQSIPINSLGIGIMVERAENVGATIDIESEPDHGTHIKVEWKKKTK